MKLKIVSDGTYKGTKVVTETGETVSNVTMVIWSADAGQTPTAHLSLANPAVELILDRENVNIHCECPHCLCPCYHSQSKGCTDENCEYR